MAYEVTVCFGFGDKYPNVQHLCNFEDPITVYSSCQYEFEKLFNADSAPIEKIIIGPENESNESIDLKSRIIGFDEVHPDCANTKFALADMKNEVLMDFNAEGIANMKIIKNKALEGTHSV